MAFAETAAALAAVICGVQHNEAPTRVTLPTESTTVCQSVMTSKGITMHRNVLLQQLYVKWF